MSIDIRISFFSFFIIDNMIKKTMNEQRGYVSFEVDSYFEPMKSWPLLTFFMNTGLVR